MQSGRYIYTASMPRRHGQLLCMIMLIYTALVKPGCRALSARIGSYGQQQFNGFTSCGRRWTGQVGQAAAASTELDDAMRRSARFFSSRPGRSRYLRRMASQLTDCNQRLRLPHNNRFFHDDYIVIEICRDATCLRYDARRIAAAAAWLLQCAYVATASDFTDHHQC